jgi:hypothetical protein
MLAFTGYPYLLYRWWPMFFVGAFIGEQIKTLQSRLKECRTSSTDADPQEISKQGFGASENYDSVSNSTPESTYEEKKEAEALA